MYGEIELKKMIFLTFLSQVGIRDRIVIEIEGIAIFKRKLAKSQILTELRYLVFLDRAL